MKYKYTLDEIKNLVSERNNKTKFIARYTIKRDTGRNITMLKLRCECGKIFTRSLDHVVPTNSTLLCNACAQGKARAKRRQRQRKKYLSNLDGLGYKLLDDSSELYADEYVDVVDKNGYRGMVRPNRKNTFQPFSPQHNEKWFIYNCNHYAKSLHIDSEVLRIVEDTQYARTTIEVRCACGNVYQTPYTSFLYRTKTYCDACSGKLSSYERRVKDYLDELGLNYKQEFVINSCKDVAPLPFDFCLLDSNILIEVDGQQHFKPVQFNNMSLENATMLLKERQRVDKIKDDYCKQWGIALLRIPYWEVDDGTYKEKINNVIKTK